MKKQPEQRATTHSQRLLYIISTNQTARTTLPERMQRVQTFIDFTEPFTTALTFLTLGFQARFDLLWEWLTLIPKVTPFPQISHFAISSTSCFRIHTSLKAVKDKSLKRKLLKNHNVYFTTEKNILQAFYGLFFKKKTRFLKNHVFAHIFYHRG